MLKHRLPGIFAGILLAAMAHAAEVPRPSPDFAINTVDGAPLQVSQYKGKVVALVFILTTCPHCQKTVGYLSTMQKEYGPRGLQVLASAVDDMGKMKCCPISSRIFSLRFRWASPS